MSTSISTGPRSDRGPRFFRDLNWVARERTEALGWHPGGEPPWPRSEILEDLRCGWTRCRRVHRGRRQRRRPFGCSTGIVSSRVVTLRWRRWSCWSPGSPCWPAGGCWRVTRRRSRT